MVTPIAEYFGGFFLAICFSFILYGMTTIQTYIYLFKFRDDSRYTYWLVVLLWISETLHTGFCMQMLYDYLIYGFGNVDNLFEIKWAAAGTVIVTIVIVTVVHSIFIQRIWLLSDRWIPAIVLPSLLLLLNIGIESFACHYYFKYSTWIEVVANKTSSTADETLAAVVVTNDIIVTATLIFYLRRRRTAMQRTNRWLTELQAYIINSGAITVAASLAVLLTWLLVRQSLLYFGLYQILCKLYDNALLALLNARPQKELPTNYLSSVEASTNSYELTLRKNIIRRNAAGISSRGLEIRRDIVVESDLQDKGASPARKSYAL